ncbi:MAG: DUF4920 domain-containing protein [Bacteroidia bacterium]|jgi:hypothetical protein|nr:DUF4920 domain-containing protein [Bacteroidia bacterium]
MKKLIALVFISAIVIACNNDPRIKLPQTGSYGVSFTETTSLTTEQLVKALDTTNTISVQVSGTVSEYCKGEGCWLTLKNSDGEDVFVNVKDKAFLLPYNIEGKKAIINGIAIKDTANGKTELSIEAEGIVLKD